VAAQALGLPLNAVYIAETATDKVRWCSLLAFTKGTPAFTEVIMMHLRCTGS
jgi:hypothetical protein